MAYQRKGNWGGDRRSTQARARLAANDDEPNPQPSLPLPEPKAPTGPKPEIIIPPEVVERSKIKGPAGNTPIHGPPAFFSPFTPRVALHPPEPTMAMDEQQIIIANASWAANSFASAFAEGVTFLGYPYLSDLAQRSEYRVIVETIATEMTRKWIKLQAATNDEEKPGQEGDDAKRSNDKDKTARIKELTDFMTELKVRDAFREVTEHDGFFGRGHIYPDTGDTDSPDELKLPIGNGWNEISKAKVNRSHPLLRLKTVEPVWTYPTRYNSNDPLKPDWYNPEQWMVQGKELHQSRLLTFIGREVPDLLKPAYSFGGLPLTQMAKPYVDNWLRTRQSVADLIHSFSVFALSTNLQASLQNGGDNLFRRAALFTNFRDNKGLMLLDKDQEELNSLAVPLGTLDALQAQTQEHMAAVSRIPLVKLLGIQPAGLNASSEGEIRSFYDTIAAYQLRLYWEKLHRVIGFCMLSLWDEVDPDITFEFESLWALSEKEEGEVHKLEAETDGILIDKGVIAPEEARARVAAAPDSPYSSIDVDDVPEPPVEEGLIGGDPGGGDDPKPGAGDDPEAAQDGMFPFGTFDEWRESDHPRGQPGNAGQFGPGGGGSSKNDPPVVQKGGPAGLPFVNQFMKEHGTMAKQAAYLERQPTEKLKTALALIEKHKAVDVGARHVKQMVEKELAKRLDASEPKRAGATALFQPTAKTAAQIVDEFPGAREAIDHVSALLAAQTPTNAPVSQGGFKQEDGTYTMERRAVHLKIVNEIFTPEAIARAMPAEGEKPVLTMLGGRGGSGKSWLTSDKGPVDAKTSILLDSDAIKALLPGYEGWNAALYHEESTDILALVDRRATALGVNTIHDATIKSESTAVLRMVEYEAAGYEVEGFYMYLGPEEAAKRAMSRFSKGGKFTGRFVPPEVILSNVNNEKNFDKLSGGMRRWAVYDNSRAEKGQDPEQVSRSW